MRELRSGLHLSSSAGLSPSGTAHLGVISLVTFFGRAKKVTRPREGTVLRSMRKHEYFLPLSDSHGGSKLSPMSLNSSVTYECESYTPAKSRDEGPKGYVLLNEG